MDTEVIITGLKVAGAVIGGVLGVVGVLFNFKNSDGRVTYWGVAVILGIVLSSVVGVITSITEGFKGRLEAAEQAARTEHLLRGLSRLMQPITELSISYTVALPSEAPTVRSYLQKLSKELEPRLPELERLDFPRDADLRVTSVDRDGAVTIDIAQKSKFWPRGDELLVGFFAQSLSFNMHLRRTPIEAENFDSVHAVNDGRSDWIAMALPLNKNNVLSYKPKTGALEIRGHAEYDRGLWTSNGKIASVEDLHGAQLFLIPPFAFNMSFPPRYANPADLSPALKDLSRTIAVDYVRLTFAAGRDIWIDGKALKKSRFKDGFPVFSIILPDNDEGFERIRPRE